MIGIDEVGRGCWAGPLVVGAVLLPREHGIIGLDDSKKLSAKKRRELADIVMSKYKYGLGWVSALEIDEIGLSAALRLASVRAYDAVGDSVAKIVIDGTVNFLAEYYPDRDVVVVPKADGSVPAVSAASIVAKVARDDYMLKQDKIYTGYSFSRHVGYGTAAHREALARLGPTPLHRMSFAPLKKLDNPIKQPVIGSSGELGQRAEDLVVDLMVKRGFRILGRNWRRLGLEIDIIAQLNDRIYFVEVRYRKATGSISPLDSVTGLKQSHIRRGVQRYLKETQSSLAPALVVAGVSGSPMKLTNWLELGES